jgi:hypothetical protein
MGYRIAPAEDFRVFYRDVYKACGDMDDPDWEELEQVILQQDAVLVFVKPERVYGRIG